VTFVDFDIAPFIGLLHSGNNLLAIDGLNASTTSSDFLISVALVKSVSVPKSDPSLSPDAVLYTGAIPLTQTTRIKTRILDNGQWSALNEAVYEVPAQN
jgi:hypothetical protein